MASFIGIDLGTTYSSVSYLDETGRPQIIRNSEGHNLTPSCIEIIGNEKVEGIKVVRTELGEADQNGRRVPIPIPGSELIIEADAVIIAFGFRASPSEWFKDFNINTQNNGLVLAAEEQQYKFQTSNNKIFSGGDMVRGSDLVVTAIWEGREAAKSIIEYVS